MTVSEAPAQTLSELARLGARLIIQRAVEDEFDAWLGRARYGRRPEARRVARSGFGPRAGQPAEGARPAKLPRGREAPAACVSRVFARAETVVLPRPLWRCRA